MRSVTAVVHSTRKDTNRNDAGTAAVILMAGASSRMGRPKALVELGGTPLLARALRAARDAGVDDVILVLGGDHELIRARVDTSGAHVVVNPDPERGMASSLALGIEATPPGTHRVCVLLGDQPMVDGALVRRLLDLQQRSGLPAAAVCAAGVLMPPAVISGVFVAMARDATGDTGLRGGLRTHPDLVAVLDVSPADVADVDTTEDLDLLERRLRG